VAATTVRTWLRAAGLGPVGTGGGMTWREFAAAIFDVLRPERSRRAASHDGGRSPALPARAEVTNIKTSHFYASQRQAPTSALTTLNKSVPGDPTRGAVV
jgi:hypothetical protein